MPPKGKKVTTKATTTALPTPMNALAAQPVLLPTTSTSTKTAERDIEKVLLSLRDKVASATDLKTLEDLQKGAEVAGGYKKILRDLTFNLGIDTAVKNDLLQKTFSDLASLLKKCGDLCSETGEVKTGDVITKTLKYYTDSAIHLGHVLTLSNDIGNSADTSRIVTEQMHHLNKRMIEVGSILQGEELDRVLEQESLKSLDELSHKQELMYLRSRAKQEIGKFCIPEGTYAVPQEVFDEISNEIKTYMSVITQEAITKLGTPPCDDFSVVGLGSLALRQMTPYSDLEFAILTKDEGYKQDSDPKVTNYFKILAHYMRFIVAAHGGTPIHPGMYNEPGTYEVSTLDYGNKAISFDTGGHTPLGTIDGTKRDYDLVCTVDKMIEYLDGTHNERVKEKNPKLVSPTLPKALLTTCLIYKHGTQDLHSEYQTKASEFFLTEGRGTKLGIDILSGEDLATTGGDLKKFSFHAHDKEGQIFDVKQEIYRIPDRLIHNLGLIYGVRNKENGLSAVEVIQELQKLHFISEAAANNLKFAITYANTLRLRAYDHYGKQKESMDIRPEEMREVEREVREVREKVGEITTKLPQERFHLTKEEVSENGALFQYYYSALPLLKKLEGLCKKFKESNLTPEEMHNFFKSELFYQDTNDTKAQVCMRLMMHDEHLKYELANLEELLPMDLEVETLNTQNLLYMVGCVKAERIADSLSGIGRIYDVLGNYKKAFDYINQGLSIRQELFGEESHDTATSLCNIGVVHQKSAHYEEALKGLNFNNLPTYDALVCGFMV